MLLKLIKRHITGDIYIFLLSFTYFIFGFATYCREINVFSIRHVLIFFQCFFDNINGTVLHSSNQFFHNLFFSMIFFIKVTLQIFGEKKFFFIRAMWFMCKKISQFRKVCEFGSKTFFSKILYKKCKIQEKDRFF